MDFSFLFRESPFTPWSLDHTTPIVVTLAIGVICIFCAKQWLSSRQQQTFLLILSSIPLAALLFFMGVQIVTGIFDYKEDLPVHVCRLLAFIAPWAYWTKNKLWIGIIYFWILVGTFNAVLTPDLQQGFPHWEHLCYFIMHIGLVVLPLYHTIVFGHRIKYKDLWNAFIAANVMLIISLIINWLLNSNYMYTCAKPPVATLLDVLGPWPLYLASVQLIGLLLFHIVYLPFYFLNRKPHPKTTEPKTAEP